MELASCKSLDWTTGPQGLEPQIAPTHAAPTKHRVCRRRLAKLRCLEKGGKGVKEEKGVKGEERSGSCWAGRGVVVGPCGRGWGDGWFAPVWKLLIVK